MTDASPSRELALDRPDRVDAITAFLTPTIDDILSRIEGDEFTTTEFIALLQSDPEANAAYLEALRRWERGTVPRRWWSMVRSSPGYCAGRSWSSGSVSHMAKTIHTQYPGAGAWSNRTTINQAPTDKDRVASPITR